MTPIRKGQSPVKIPFPLKSNHRILAAWCNEVRQAIQQIESRIPTAPVARPSAGGSRPPFWTAISKVPASDPATYQVTVTLGYLSYQSNTPAAQASDLGVTGWIVPQIGGVSMESEDVEPLELPAVESWVYLRVKTDVDGFPKEGEVTVEAFDEAQESVHHIRLSPESGEEEGDYFFLILKTKSDDATPPKPISERRITGNREMPNQLIEILNLGEEDEGGRYEVYKGYDIALDKHDLRAVMQQQTPGVAIIEPLDPGEDEIPPVVDAEGTVVTKGVPAVPPEEPGDYIRWRTIDGRGYGSESQNEDTRKQIEVREREEEDQAQPGRTKKVVEVVGNDYTTSESSVSKFTMSINDGLVTEFLKEEGGDGWWGNVQLLDLGTSAELNLHFEAGNLVRVGANYYGAGLNDIPGTEAAPGVVSINF